MRSLCKGSSKNALSLSLKTVRFDLSDYQELVIRQFKNQWKPSSKCHKPLKFDHIAHDNQSKSKKNSDQVSCPSSTGKEKWMKLTGRILFLTQLFDDRTSCHTPLSPITITNSASNSSETYSNITLTFVALSHSHPSPTPFLDPGTFALNSQTCNPLFEKIVDPPLHNKGIFVSRLHFSINKFLAAAFLAINIHLSKFWPIMVEVVICRREEGTVTNGAKWHIINK